MTKEVLVAKISVEDIIKLLQEFSPEDKNNGWVKLWNFSQTSQIEQEDGDRVGVGMEPVSSVSHVGQRGRISNLFR